MTSELSRTGFPEAADEPGRETAQEVWDPVFGTRYRFATERDEAGEEIQIVEAEVVPGGGVPAHVHPVVEERFTVERGTLELLEGRRWRAVEAGESATVPAGTRHAFRNRGADPAAFTARATPPSTLAEFLTDAAALSRAGLIGKLGLPTSPRGLLYAAVLVERNREMVTMGFPLPPAPLQRVVFGPLAALGRRRGIESGRFADSLGV